MEMVGKAPQHEQDIEYFRARIIPQLVISQQMCRAGHWRITKAPEDKTQQLLCRIDYLGDRIHPGYMVFILDGESLRVGLVVKVTQLRGRQGRDLVVDLPPIGQPEDLPADAGTESPGEEDGGREPWHDKPFGDQSTANGKILDKDGIPPPGLKLPAAEMLDYQYWHARVGESETVVKLRWITSGSQERRASVWLIGESTSAALFLGGKEEDKMKGILSYSRGFELLRLIPGITATDFTNSD